MQQLIVNPIVYAEIAPRFANCQEIDTVLAAANVHFMAIPREAAFLASKAYQHTAAGVAPRPTFCQTFSLAPTRRCWMQQF